MPDLPLAIDAYKRSDSFAPDVECVNMFLEEDKSGLSPDKIVRIGRPGLTLWTTVASPIRGLFRSEGLFDSADWAAAGSRLYRFTASTTTNVGWIGTGGRVPMVANYEKLFLLSAMVAFQYDGTGLDGIAMPDARDVADIDVLNNFAMLLCPDGRFYWLEPGQDEVDAINFATAESSADGAVAGRAIGDEYVILGTRRSEVWQPTGAGGADAFQRAPGRNFDVGCLSRDTVVRFDNSLVWVAPDNTVRRLDNVPRIISHAGVSQKLRDRTGLPSAFECNVDGSSFYVLKIPGQGSMAFNAASGTWSEWESDGEDEWRPHVSSRIEDGWLLGDETSGKVWLFDPDAKTDDGTAITRRLTGAVPVHGLAGRNDSFSIMAGAHQDFEIAVRWKDGQSDYVDDPEVLEMRAPMDVGSLYRLGQPDQPYRTFEVTITDPVRPSIYGVKINEAFG